MNGTRLGSYEIATRIGAGGMGEVYRATDTKLGRDVAIKVLPAELASDPERLAPSGARRSCWPRSTTPASLAETPSLDGEVWLIDSSGGEATGGR